MDSENPDTGRAESPRKSRQPAPAVPARESLGSAPGSDLLPPAERHLFIEQFERDLQFFQLLFLLINRSCAIQNVDLVWVEGGSSDRSRIRHLGTTEALASPCSRLLGFQKQNPHPFFCNIINNYGRHDTESCGVSDKAAEDVVRQTGKAHVYRCNFGLIDIAVPVMLNGQHVATLLTGQVLLAPPTHEGFVQIAKDVAKLSYVDVRQLEAAYWQVPVVNEADIQTATEILQTLADFLANSWLRLTEALKERRRKDRELQLSRKEFAYLALEWGDADRAKVSTEEIAEIMQRIGFTRPPNRVLVVKIQAGEEGHDHKFSLTGAVPAVTQTIEELCDKLNNVAAARLWMSSICVFFNDPKTSLDRSREFYAHRLATKILHAVSERCDLGVRIGIGNSKDDWRNLVESYREACLALAASEKTVATYQKPAGSLEELSRHTEDLCRLISERKLEEARTAVASLPVLVSRRLGSDSGDFAVAALFFASALEAVCFTARKLGCDGASVASLCDAANAELKRASNIFQMHEAWLRFAGHLLEEVARLYSGKRQKIVERACRMVDYSLERSATAHKVSISEVAAELGMSDSHISRMFRRETGQTFEQFLIGKRIELAKRLLLDPLNKVSEVARRCGFSDPSYFARVFRKVLGCSPGEYCENPLRHPSVPRPMLKVPEKADKSLSVSSLGH